MKRKTNKDVGTAAKEFAEYFPDLARDLKYIAKRHGDELKSKYGHDLSSIISELLRKPKAQRGRPGKPFATLDHEMLAMTIDEVLVPAHQKNGASDPLDAAIAEATELERQEGRPKSTETVRKYYWLGRRKLDLLRKNK